MASRKVGQGRTAKVLEGAKRLRSIRLMDHTETGAKKTHGRGSRKKCCPYLVCKSKERIRSSNENGGKEEGKRPNGG